MGCIALTKLKPWLCCSRTLRQSTFSLTCIWLCICAAWVKPWCEFFPCRFHRPSRSQSHRDSRQAGAVTWRCRGESHPGGEASGAGDCPLLWRQGPGLRHPRAKVQPCWGAAVRVGHEPLRLEWEPYRLRAWGATAYVEQQYRERSADCGGGVDELALLLASSRCGVVRMDMNATRLRLKRRRRRK